MSGCNIAVLMTCRNRRDTTLACLEALRAASGNNNVDVFLVDDGSTDGTGDAVREHFPAVQVLQGTGELYWGGGMRLAQQAAGTEHDFVLWLNDDVILRPTAFDTLLGTSRELAHRGHEPSIVVGAVIDPDTGRTAYSGVVRRASSRPTRFSLVEPSADTQPCETFSGNVVLIPEQVRRRVGDIDEAFTHSIADFDYGLRARASGCEVWLAPGTVGECRWNATKGRWRDPATPLRDRIRIGLSPKGLPPREWLVFTRRHAGPWWPIFWISPYVNALLGRASKTDALAASLGERSVMPP